MRIHMRITALILLAAASASATGDTATGLVFEDTNRNGAFDAGEPGIEGVRVSNGIDVVLTDGSGRYRIDALDESVIFITKPRGYVTPVNAHMLPQFYYIHQPNGSPDGLRYGGIKPTGPLPASIDFALARAEEPDSFEAILMSDTQPQTERELDYIRDDVVAELIGTDAAFGMTMGDILYDDLSLFDRYNALIAQIGIPWYNVPGNHELNFESPDDRYSLETFKRYFGPPYFAFEYGEALFVILDNIYYKGNGESDPGDVRGSGGYDNLLTRDQLRWLERELAHVDEDRLVFIATHAPLGSASGAYATGNRERLFRLLAGRPNLYSVAGHTHTTDHLYFDKEDGFPGPGTFHHHVLATVSGGWWSGPFDERGIPTTDQRDGTPNGYHILEVNGADASVRYKGAGKPADYQMRIVFDVAHHGLNPNGMRDFKPGVQLDGRMSSDALNAASIIVNLFDGGPKSRVEYRIDDGAFMPMERVVRADPFMLQVYARNADTKKSWLSASPSSHIFEADLLDSLDPGTYTVEVRAVDEFGKSHHGHAVLEIVAGSAGSEAGLAYPD